MATKNIIDSNNPIEVGKGGTGVASTTAHGVLVGGTTSTGALQNVGTGTVVGQLLTSAGSSAVPTWSMPTAGFVLIQTITATGSPATVDFTTGITTQFNDFLVLITNYVPVTNGTSLLMQISETSGSPWYTSNYWGGALYAAFSSATQNNANTNSGFLIIPPSSSTASNGTASAMFWMNNITTNVDDPRYYGQASFYSTVTATSANATTAGNYLNATVANAFRFIPTSGQITSGTFSLYGINV